MSEELKSCPFCGGEAEYIMFKEGHNRVHSVFCNKCEVEKTFRTCVMSDVLSKEHITEAWNTRADQPEESHWQPISTVPKDGTKIYISDGKYVEEAFWGEGECYEMGWVTDHSSYEACYSTNSDMEPTHWMHIPKRPKPPKEQE